MTTGEKKIAYMKEYNKRPYVIAKEKAYRQRPEVRARRNKRCAIYQREWRKRPQNIEKIRAYRQRPEVKARDNKRRCDLRKKGHFRIQDRKESERRKTRQSRIIWSKNYQPFRNAQTEARRKREKISRGAFNEIR